MTAALPCYTDLCADFALFETPQERYDYILELGKQLPPIPAHYQTDDFLVKGCLSRVWIAPHADNTGFYAQSDAIVVRGLLYVLLCAAQQCVDWQNFSARNVLQHIELEGFISTQRAGGLEAAAQYMRQHRI